MHNHCERILFKIDSITYIPLTALEKYIVIPQQKTTLDTNCNTHTTKVINSAHLKEANTNCIIQTPNSMMKISPGKSNLTWETKLINVNVNMSEEQTLLLQEHLKETPIVLKNLKEYSKTLEESSDLLTSLEHQYRIRTTVETGLSILKILGYIALVLVTLYSLYKISKCSNILIGCKNCLNTSSTVDTQISAPTRNLPNYIQVQPEEFEMPTIIHQHQPLSVSGLKRARRIRFGEAKSTEGGM